MARTETTPSLCYVTEYRYGHSLFSRVCFNNLAVADSDFDQMKWDVASCKAVNPSKFPRVADCLQPVTRKWRAFSIEYGQQLLLRSLLSGFVLTDASPLLLQEQAKPHIVPSVVINFLSAV